MKISENFINCANAVDEEIKKLICKLPCLELAKLSNILAVKLNGNTHVVKIRDHYVKQDGTPDIDKINNIIKSADFIELSRADYANLDKHESISSRTRKLMQNNTNIIFNFD